MTTARRPQEMPRLARVVGALAAVVLTAVAFAPTTSATVPHPTAVSANALGDATSATQEARLLRRETVAMLGRYLADYGSRFTTAENDELRAYRSNADRQLAGVVVTTKRLQTAVATGAPRRDILAVGRAAQRSHQRARAAAQASYEGARRIMEPQLSLFEGISAIRDYDAMLGRFDDLGDRIDAVVATVD